MPGLRLKCSMLRYHFVFPSIMNKIVRAVAKYSLVLFFIVMCYKIFVPRRYPAPPVERRKGTKFMQLSTGSRIAYTMLEGTGKKKPSPIIYLHGGPGGYRSDKIIEIFSTFASEGYDVILYDQIGGGESGRLDKIKEYTVDRHVNDLHEIITQSGYKKAILIAQSWGGVLAVYYVSRYSGDIEKIVFANPGPIYPYPERLNEVMAPDSLQLKSPVFTNAQGNAKSNNVRTKVMKYVAIHFGIKLASDDEADAFSTYAAYEINKSTVYDTSKTERITAVASAPRSGYYAGIMTFKNLIESKNPRPQLKNIDIPVLVLKSQYDNQIWGGTNEYLEIFKRHQFKIIPNAGHFITREQPELFLKYIRDFLHD